MTLDNLTRKSLWRLYLLNKNKGYSEDAPDYVKPFQEIPPVWLIQHVDFFFPSSMDKCLWNNMLQQSRRL